MKSRIIQTRFWDDEFVVEAKPTTRYLYIYLLTSQYINISGVFQLPDKKILQETGLRKNQFVDSRAELVDNSKVLFYKGWIFVANAMKNNNYTNSPDNQKAYEREISRVPTDVLQYFDSTVHSSPYSTNKQEIINNKSKTINHKTEINTEYVSKQNTPFTFKDFLVRRDDG